MSRTAQVGDSVSDSAGVGASVSDRPVPVTASGFTTASIIGTTAGFIGLIVSGVVFTEGKRAKQAIEQQGPNAALLLGPAGAGVQVRF